MRNKTLIPIVEILRDGRMQQEEGGDKLLYYKFKNFCPIFAEFNMNIKLKLKMKKTKGDNDFTWKPSWSNKKEKPRPPRNFKILLLCFRQSITIT